MQIREDLTPHASSFEYELAGAVYHWVNYVKACGNVSLIEEHSIRYPLAEFMERKCQYRVKLEEGIKSMKRKRYDFFFEYGEETIQMAILKYNCIRTELSTIRKWFSF